MAGMLCWITTAAGAGIVFLNGKLSRKLLESMLGFATSVMIAASIWSLIEPSIEMSEALGIIE